MRTNGLTASSPQRRITSNQSHILIEVSYTYIFQKHHFLFLRHYSKIIHVKPESLFLHYIRPFSFTALIFYSHAFHPDIFVKFCNWFMPHGCGSRDVHPSRATRAFGVFPQFAASRQVIAPVEPIVLYNICLPTFSSAFKINPCCWVQVLTP